MSTNAQAGGGKAGLTVAVEGDRAELGSAVEELDTAAGHSNLRKTGRYCCGKSDAFPERRRQVRDGVEFYPSALERGVRSDRALKLAWCHTGCRRYRRSGCRWAPRRLSGYGLASANDPHGDWMMRLRLPPF